MSVFTGKPPPPELQALGTVVGQNVMAQCFESLRAARVQIPQATDGETSSMIAQGVIAGLLQFAAACHVPPEASRELIIGTTDSVLAQLAMHAMTRGQPLGRA